MNSVTINCRHCGRPMHQARQGVKPAKVNGEIVFTDTVTLVDCRHNDCPLYYVTLEVNNYLAADLRPYYPNDEDTEKIQAVL